MSADDDWEVMPDAAKRVGNAALNESRDNGCDCDPNIEMSPCTTAPFWQAMVYHDEWCKLLRHLRSNQN